MGTVFSNFVPPLPGVTPATRLVPYAAICDGVEGTVAAGDALHHQASITIDQHAHESGSFRSCHAASAMAFFTASSMVSAG